jgi:hypothetical protein
MRITEIAAGGRPLDSAKIVSRSLMRGYQAKKGATSCQPSQIIFSAT